MNDDFPALSGLTDTEIKQAASFWILFSTAYAAGTEVPVSVFALDYRDLTEADVEATRRVTEEMLKGLTP